jgi:hypothetical protein
MNTDESQGKNRGFCCPCFSVFSAVEPEKKGWPRMNTDESQGKKQRFLLSVFFRV